jgi:hypothetical protein
VRLSAAKFCFLIFKKVLVGADIRLLDDFGPAADFSRHEILQLLGTTMA